MPIKDLLKTMFHSFFVITTGVTMAMYISCRLLYPDTVLSVGDIGGILLLALFCDLSFFNICVRERAWEKTDGGTLLYPYPFGGRDCFIFCF